MRQLENALNYLERGFSVIPVKPNKKPYISWEQFQKRRPTEDEIRQWWTKWPFAMIGIITGSISGIDVIDTDTKEADDELQGYLSDSFVCPTQRTPGGGKHYVFTHAEGIRNSNDRSPFKFHVRGEGGYFIASPSENGTGGHYAWLDGLSIEEIPPPPMPNTLYNSLINAFVLYGGGKEKTKEEHTKAHEGTRKHKILTLGRRDNDLFHVANALIRANTPIDDVEQYLEILANSCDPIFSLSEISEKIKSALKRAEQRDRNISQEVREWVESTRGHFESTQVHREAHLSTKEEMHAVNVALQRLVKEGILERYGDKRGAYRRVENECVAIDLESVDDAPLEIKYPFGEEKLVKTLPKHIVIIAGGTNSGKTAWALNMTRLNMNSWKVHYFSSEMSASELKDRVKKFGMPLSEWKKVSFIERSDKFSDVVVPSDLNIVDYMEVSGGIGHEFYRIGEDITAIHNKLTTGVAVICLQKNPGQDLARGGLGSIEKSRLYISMDSGKAKIIKGKLWQDPKVNPHKMELSFKLVDGCRFIIERDWSKPIDIPSPYHETSKQYKFGRKKLGKDDLCKEFERRMREE